MCCEELSLKHPSSVRPLDNFQEKLLYAQREVTLGEETQIWVFQIEKIAQYVLN